ncbi:hypothetical protein JVU11DRAFT_3614 [Chiua virens]|nr:hypothetical protein JVU11DRAFT_3614 [Chiua virens]
MSHVDLSPPGALKRKIDIAFSDEETGLDSTDDDHGSQVLDISRFINDEFNLEVAIRERLINIWMETIFKMLRLMLSRLWKRQSSFLFDTGYPEERSPSPSFSPIVPNPPAPQRAPKTRSSRTPKPSQQQKHLYIKLSSGTTDNLRDGVEVPWGGNVVGLRRLFERAVGVDGVSLHPPSAHSSLDIPFPESSAPTPSTLLSRTLGLHADSAALAQFLGRAPKRRCIHVYGEDQDADIIALDSTASLPGKPPSGETVPPKKSFCMRYPHRNIARKDFDLQVDVDKEAETANTNDTTTPAISSTRHDCVTIPHHSAHPSGGP